MWWTGTVHRFQEVGQSSLLCLWGGVVLEISSPAIEVPAPSLMQRAQSGAMDVTLLPNRTRGVNLLVVLDLGCFVNFSCLFDSKMTPNDFDTPKLDVVSPELNYAGSQNSSPSLNSRNPLERAPLSRPCTLRAYYATRRVCR